ncbi:hypothetical protein GGX14DRAFT_559740 [Mycena pura]|uniref:Uncharacterized protein n=1 Tax=Mycena pura TaxID=153505 RepID=A0AAD6VWH8_9AGAR|nr:hypothetical protein GGX14DRAFT_559740 [Mycena pura]
MTHWIHKLSLPSTTTIKMSSASNNTSGGSGSGRNKGKARETLSDVARRIELERRQAELAEQLAALQVELAQLKRGDNNNNNEDDDDDDYGGHDGGHDEENDGGREEETNAGQKRLAPEEGGKVRQPEKKRRRKRYGPDVPNQWEANRDLRSLRSLPTSVVPLPADQRPVIRRKFVRRLSAEEGQVQFRAGDGEVAGEPPGEGENGQVGWQVRPVHAPDCGSGSSAGFTDPDYLRGNPLEDLRTRLTAVEIWLGIEPGGRLYRIEESEPPSPLPPPPVPKIERLTSPQLVFEPDDEPNEGTMGPPEERAEQREPGEEQPGEGAMGKGQPGKGAPEEGQPGEVMEVDVPEEAAQVEVPVEAQVVVAPVEVPEEVRANPPPEEERPEPEIKVEPEERRVPRPKEVIKARKVQGKFKDQDVEFIEIL